MTSLAADRTSRRRNIVLDFIFVLPHAFVARFVLLKGIQILRVISAQIQIRGQADSSVCASDVVDSDLQCFSRRQPSTAEDKMLLQ